MNRPASGFHQPDGGTAPTVSYAAQSVSSTRWDLLTLLSGLTVIADLAAIDPLVKLRGSTIWPNTFTQAQKYNLQMQKVVEEGYLAYSYYATFGSLLPAGVPMPQAHRTNGFLNDYYDDEGWWALAWWGDLMLSMFGRLH